MKKQMTSRWQVKICTLILSLILSSGAALLAEPEPQLLWPNGAADSNGLEGPERVRACIGNISIPTLTVYHAPEEITHKGSRRDLMGNEDLVDRYSNELRVTAETPPCFLLHCTDDRTVKVENSLRFYQALVANGVPASLAVFEKGGHGPNAFKKNPSWEGVLDGWLKGRGCLK